jgi:hypothetical protein
MNATTAAAPTLEDVLDALDVCGHPLRARILLELIYGGEASPNDLAGERITEAQAAAYNATLPGQAGPGAKPVKPNPRGLGTSLGTVAYHVRCLVDDDLIHLCRESRVRGAVEHHYVITEDGAAKVAALTRLELAEERADD